MPPSGPSEQLTVDAHLPMPSSSGLATSGLKNIKTGAPSIVEPLPFGAEVIGRTISFYHAAGGRGRWGDESFEIISFDAATGKHSARMEGSKDLHQFALQNSKFKWIQKPSHAATPNPSWAGSPQGHEAVGCKVRVFWPGGLHRYAWTQ